MAVRLRPNKRKILQLLSNIEEKIRKYSQNKGLIHNSYYLIMACNFHNIMSRGRV